MHHHMNALYQLDSLGQILGRCDYQYQLCISLFCGWQQRKPTIQSTDISLTLKSTTYSNLDQLQIQPIFERVHGKFFLIRDLLWFLRQHSELVQRLCIQQDDVISAITRMQYEFKT